MSWQSDMFAALSGNAPVAAIVAARIYPDVAADNAVAPYLVYQTISTGGENTHDGDRTHEFPLVQFTSWAATKPEAIALARAVDRVIGGKTIQGQSKVSFQFSNQLGNHDPETKLFGEILEYRASALLTN